MICIHIRFVLVFIIYFCKLSLALYQLCTFTVLDITIIALQVSIVYMYVSIRVDSFCKDSARFKEDAHFVLSLEVNK